MLPRSVREGLQVCTRNYKKVHRSLRRNVAEGDYLFILIQCRYR